MRRSNIEITAEDCDNIIIPEQLSSYNRLTSPPIASERARTKITAENCDNIIIPEGFITAENCNNIDSAVVGSLDSSQANGNPSLSEVRKSSDENWNNALPKKVPLSKLTKFFRSKIHRKRNLPAYREANSKKKSLSSYSEAADEDGCNDDLFTDNEKQVESRFKKRIPPKVNEVRILAFE
jgi:hypothetical protein